MYVVVRKGRQCVACQEQWVSVQLLSIVTKTQGMMEPILAQVRIARDTLDQSPKGFAFVTFKDKAAAAKAVAEFTELEIKVRLSLSSSFQISPFFSRDSSCMSG